MLSVEKAEVIAKVLLEAEAVKLNPENPYTWASGWKSPIYCDNRITLAYPEIRKMITQQLVERVKQLGKIDAIAGVATAGIPQAALVAEALNLPMAYVRSAPKNHGTQSQIEGKLAPGQRIVLIEDLISTGGSAIKAALAVAQSGVEIVEVLAVFSYGFTAATEAFKAAGLAYFALSNYDILLSVLLQQNAISQAQLSTLSQWRISPKTWNANGK